MRYFRSSVEVYASICSQLDAAYGYPNDSTKTARTLPLPEALPSDSQGRVYLAVQQWFCDYVLPSELLLELVGIGAVEEITQSQYEAVLPQPQPLP